MLLVLLQNAWSGFYTRVGTPNENEDDCWRTLRSDNRIWYRQNWIDATWSCPSGQRLMRILDGIPEGSIWLDNTTLSVADKASGVKPPDFGHVRSVITDHLITCVVACGKQASEVIDRCWSGSLVKIPHPAYRKFSKEAVESCNYCIKTMIGLTLEQSFPFRCTVNCDGVIS